MLAYEKLFELSNKLKSAASRIEADEVFQPIDAIEKAANLVEKSFSGSWLGVSFACLL